MKTIDELLATTRHIGVNLTRRLEWRNDGNNPPDQLPEDTGSNTYGVWVYTCTFPDAIVTNPSVSASSYISLLDAVEHAVAAYHAKWTKK